MKEKLDRLLERLSQPGSAPAIAAVLGGGVLLIAVIVWASLRAAPPPPAPLPDGMPWICKNGHQFTLTGQQMAEHAKHPSEPVVCPTCGAEAARAVTCPHCGNVVVPTPDHVCPVCKQPILHY